MTFEKVAKIIADYKDIDIATITPESTFAELGAHIEMSPDLKTVQDIVTLIDQQA